MMKEYLVVRNIKKSMSMIRGEKVPSMSSTIVPYGTKIPSSFMIVKEVKEHVKKDIREDVVSKPTRTSKTIKPRKKKPIKTNMEDELKNDIS